MNIKQSKFLVPMILSGAVLIGTSSVYAQPQFNDSGKPTPQCARANADRGAKQGPLEKMTTQLQLNDKQQSQVKAIMKESRGEAKPVVRDLQKARFDFKQAVTADNYDQKMIDQLAQAQANDMAKLMSLKAKTSNEIKSVLNDDQQIKFERMQQKMQHKMKKKWVRF